MVAAIKQLVTVEPDGTIRIQSSLKPGTRAEIEATVRELPEKKDRLTWASLRGSAKGVYATPEEADAFIRAERDAWD